MHMELAESLKGACGDQSNTNSSQTLSILIWLGLGSVCFGRRRPLWGPRPTSPPMQNACITHRSTRQIHFFVFSSVRRPLPSYASPSFFSGELQARTANLVRISSLRPGKPPWLSTESRPSRNICSRENQRKGQSRRCMLLSQAAGLQCCKWCGGV